MFIASTKPLHVFYEKPTVVLVNLEKRDVIVTSTEPGGDIGIPEGNGKKWLGEWDSDI